MGIVVNKQSNKTAIQERIDADLKARLQSAEDKNMHPESSDYLEDTKKTGRFGWIWFILIILAIISIILIVMI